MDELTDDQALSVLSRLDAEQRSFDQLNAARKHVSGVIQRYQTVLKLLPQREQELAALDKTLAGQQDTHAVELRKRKQAALDEIQQTRAQYQQELTSLKTRVEQDRQTATTVKQETDKIVAAAKERRAEAESELAQVEKRLSALKSELADLKAKHALA